ncbi:MAG: MBL fold metallo-hydrolase [Clostridia bacterium]|nr:MBL fold metallo-hydrolase [Clostridia bacterium]
MKLTFLGAAHEVTGSCTLLSACGYNILIDCGMEQGADTYENCDIPVSPAEIDCVLLTHAHIDHSGKIPMLVANGYKGPVFSTSATQKLCSIMLLDSAHIQELEALWKNKRAARSGEGEYKPLYTTEDVHKTLPLFKGCEYSEKYDIFDGISVRFIDAGHLLGSASIEITVNENGEEKTILFSGDVGNISRPLIRDPQKPKKADFVVIESTYGDRLHGARPDYVTQLTRIIQDTFDNGGNVIIPCFAIGRTQEMLYLIREIKERKLINGHSDFPVWVDSPLAVEATEIYSNDDELMAFYDDETLKLLKENIEPIKFRGLNLSVTSDESKKINSDGKPKIILSASGMCEAGRIRHHLKHNLWRKECSVLFVGYQAHGTLGRMLTDGARHIKLFGEDIQVRAKIEKLDGISGHADKNMLLDWLDNIDEKPERIFVNHGDDNCCENFAETVSTALGITAVAPYNGAVYDLITGECIEKGNTKILEKKSKKPSNVYERLVLAGKHLMDVIYRNKGGTNKDLSKFADQINDLARKWDR